MRPIHPGEILREEYLAPLGMSANALAHAIGVPANRISDVIRAKRAVTADTALRLARALKTSPQFWLNLQRSYDLRVAEERGPINVKPIEAIASRTVVQSANLAQRMRATRRSSPSSRRRAPRQKLPRAERVVARGRS
ncbi:MAG TPA: HigA family addiction module antitoxin [Polyangiaceae bacterium]|nr:HigA family addiction module antitoxin [Polyangiaceae bacterium]